MSINCGRCGTQIVDNDWFCSHCGKERPRCPDCGAEMDGTSCNNCETVRQAPCDECGLLIDVTAAECQHCEYDAVQEEVERLQEKKAKNESKFKKYLVGVGLGIFTFYFVNAIIPGPDIIGTALGVLIGGPIVSFAAIGALNSKRKQNKQHSAEDAVAANIKKGRKQNKSKAYRQKEKEQREAALNVAAKGLDAVGSAAESWGDSDSSSSSTSSLSGGSSADTFELDAVAGGTEFEMNCPRCGQHWRVADPGLSSGYRLDGAKAIGELDAIGQTKVQCKACNSTEYIDSWE